MIAGDENLFRVLINTKDRMAELLAAKSDGAPYRYVSFQVLGLNLHCKEQPVFCYYDTPCESIAEIISHLDHGMRRLFEQEPPKRSNSKLKNE